MVFQRLWLFFFCVRSGREKYTKKRMNSGSYTDDALQLVISAISSCHNKDLTNQTRAASGVTEYVVYCPLCYLLLEEPSFSLVGADFCFCLLVHKPPSSPR